jgi:hypothetical protein
MATIQIKRKSTGASGAPNTLAYGELATDGVGNLYVGTYIPGVTPIGSRQEFKVVADATARDAIAADLRVEGMVIHMLSDDNLWTLNGGILNTDWEIYNASIIQVPLVPLVTSVYPSANATAATLVTGTGDSQLTWTSKLSGYLGNKITIEFIQQIGISKTAYADGTDLGNGRNKNIVVYLGTDAWGNYITIAQDIPALIVADTNSNTWVTAVAAAYNTSSLLSTQTYANFNVSASSTFVPPLHGLSTGDVCIINGSSPIGYDGTHYVNLAPNTLQFFYSLAVDPGGASSGGTVVKATVLQPDAERLLSGGYSSVSITDFNTAGTLSTDLKTATNLVIDRLITAEILIPPLLNSVLPSSLFGGDTLTINGLAFDTLQGLSTVSIGGINSSVLTWSNTIVTATVPTTFTAATLTDVIVNVGGSNSNTMTTAVRPKLNTLSIGTGIVGSSVTLNGYNFGAAQGISTVLFGATSASVTSWSNTAVTVLVPTVAAGSQNITIVVGGETSGIIAYTITPYIASVLPANEIIGNPVTVTGTNFGATQLTSILTLNSISVTPDIVSWSDTSIVFNIPTGTVDGTYPVVITVNSEVSNSVNYQVGAATSQITSWQSALDPDITIGVTP